MRIFFITVHEWFPSMEDKKQKGGKKILLITIPLDRSYRFVGGIKSPFHSTVQCWKNPHKEEEKMWAAVRNLRLLGIFFVKFSLESSTAIKKYKPKKSL